MPYLEFYYHCVGPMLSGRFDTDFWLRTILQMAHSEPGVRSALVALGHLNKSQSGSLQHARQSSVIASSPERKPFLVNYNKAIRHLVDDMARPSFPADMGLVICLLFACIEFLQVDANMAFAHIRSGLNIFYESKQRNTKKVSALEAAQSTQTQTHVGLRWSAIEQTLVQLFTQSLASALPYGVSLEKDVDYFASCPKHFTGTTFASLIDARLSFSDLRNAAILLARDMANKVYGSVQLTSSDYRRQHDLLDRHDVWSKALNALEGSRTWSKDDTASISALKLEFYSSYTACSCMADETQMLFDAHLAGFQAIVANARCVVDSLDLDSRRTRVPTFGAAANFTFDTSFIPTLFYAAIRCRCPVTRRAAVSLLASNLPREGLWDPAQYRKVAERVIEIEEQEVDENGWPTKSFRLCRSSVGTEVDGNSRFEAEFLYAKDFALPTENSWSERLELDESFEQLLSLRPHHAETENSRQP